MLLAARAALTAFAVAACAWFALGAHQAREVSAAANLISSPPLSHSQVQQAASRLRSAATLNPDRTVDLLRAQLYADQRRYADARTVLEGVVHSEPENLQAWIDLTRYSYGAPATFARGVETIKRLLRSFPASH